MLLSFRALSKRCDDPDPEINYAGSVSTIRYCGKADNTTDGICQASLGDCRKSHYIVQLYIHAHKIKNVENLCHETCCLQRTFLK